MAKSKIFLCLCLSFIMGVAIYSSGLLSTLTIYILTIFSCCLAVVFYKPKAIIVFGIIIFLYAGFMYTRLYTINISTKLNALQAQTSIIIGTIKEDPFLTDSYQNLIVEVKNNQTKYKALIYSPFYPKYQYNDILQVQCKLIKLSEHNPQDMNLIAQNIVTRCYYPKIKTLGHSKNNQLTENLIKIKQKLSTIISNLLPEPESYFLNGLLVGGQSNYSKTLKEIFNRTGTSHLVALSGLNITIIIGIILYIFQAMLVHPRYSFYLISIFIFLFVIMTGAQPSIIRAAIMGSVLLVANKVGRLNNPTNALLATIVIMLLFNPLILRWNLGFQLSFLAMIGIIYISPILRYFSNKIKPKFTHTKIYKILSETFIITISAQLSALPLILYTFNTLPVLALPANILIIPVIPIITILGFLTGIMGFIFMPLANLFALLALILVKYVLVIIHYFASLSFAVYNLNINGFILSAYYLVLFIGLIYGTNYMRKQERLKTEDAMEFVKLRS